MRFFNPKSIAWICLSCEKRLSSVYHFKYIVAVRCIYILLLQNAIVQEVKEAEYHGERTLRNIK